MKRSIPLLIVLACMLTATSGLSADDQAEAVCTQTLASEELKQEPAAELIIGDCCLKKSDCPESDYVILVACDCGYYCYSSTKPCSCTYRPKY
jgi:hypothetical protein